MIDAPEIVRVSGFSYAYVRVCAPRSQIASVMDARVHELFAALAAQSVAPAGPLFAHHTTLDPEAFDFELGVPTKGAIEACGDLRAGRTADFDAARTIHRGPYERLFEAWREVATWAEARGLAPVDHLWERYLDGPAAAVDPDAYRTELLRPLKASDEASALF